MPLINTVLQYFEPIAHALLLSGLAFFVLVEGRSPRISAPPDKWPRLQIHVGLYVLGAVTMALVFEPLNTQAMVWGAALGWSGIAGADWPTWAKIIAGVLAMDLLQYLLHVLSHYVPWWWRLHKIHHSDTFMDASTSIRHHPLETLVNAFVLVLLMAALQIPIYAIALYALLQQFHALFCHSNLNLPLGVDKYLRWIVVTPDMHAVHHSVRMDEGNSNFGMVFPWWDHIFRSYCAAPRVGRLGMRFGITELAATRQMHVLDLLGFPFWRVRPAVAKAPVVAVKPKRSKRRH